MTKPKKVLKLSQFIDEGDCIRVMGLNCIVEMINIDHNAKTIRLECVVDGATESKKAMIIKLYWGVPVVIRK